MRPRFRPILPSETFYPRELRDVSGHERQFMVYGLPGDQDVVGADRFAGGFESRAYFACGLGVVFFKRKNYDRASQKCFEAFAVELISRAFGDAVAELENGNGRDQNQRVAGRHLLEPRPDRHGAPVNDGDAGIGIEEVVH